MSGAEERFRLQHQLCIALYHADRAMANAYRAVLRPIGLTYAQYAVMLAVWEHERTTLRQLGALLHLDSGTLSPLLRRLERMGLVVRSRDSDDERVLNVEVTDAGRAMREQALEAQQVVEAKTGLDPRSLSALRGQLDDLAARLRAGTTDSAA